MNRCVGCGDIIPESTQVCWNCNHGIVKHNIRRFKRTSLFRQQNPHMKHKPRYFQLLQGQKGEI